MPARSSFQAFTQELHQVFGKVSAWDAAAGELLMLRQGKQSDHNFAIDFWIFARQSRWPPEPPPDAFLNTLAAPMWDMVIAYPRPPTHWRS